MAILSTTFITKNKAKILSFLQISQRARIIKKRNSKKNQQKKAILLLSTSTIISTLLILLSITRKSFGLKLRRRPRL